MYYSNVVNISKNSVQAALNLYIALYIEVLSSNFKLLHKQKEEYSQYLNWKHCDAECHTISYQHQKGETHTAKSI